MALLYYKNENEQGLKNWSQEPNTNLSDDTHSLSILYQFPSDIKKGEKKLFWTNKVWEGGGGYPDLSGSTTKKKNFLCASSLNGESKFLLKYVLICILNNILYFSLRKWKQVKVNYFIVLNKIKLSRLNSVLKQVQNTGYSRLNLVWILIGVLWKEK